MNEGWPGAAGVPQLPFRRLFRRLNRPVPPEAGIVTAYTDGQVTARSNRSKERYHEAENLSSYQGVEPGDFVVHGLDIMRGSIGVSDSSGAMSPVCIVCTPTHLADSRYMAYAMRLQAASGYPKAMARGVRDGGADFRRWETLAALPLPVPPLSEQRLIANYLDRETAKIDALIEKQHRMVVLLRERRSAVLEAVVSASEAHLAPLGTTCALIQTGPFGSQLGADDYVDDGVPVINPQHLAGGIITPQASVSVDEGTANRLGRHRVQVGDVVAARRGELGRCAVVDSASEGFICGTGSLLIRPRRSAWNPRYLQVILSARKTAEHLQGLSVGSTMANINTGMMARLRLPCPPLSEQDAAMVRVNRETAKIDALITKAERFTELARERRAALITAAVTGQIDVSRKAS